MTPKYYFFNPFSKQYYFPKGFAQHRLFTNFYQAYTFKGMVLWMVWLKCSLLRWACLEKHPEKALPLDHLQNHAPENSLLAFNRGTIGAEQKTTVLGIDQKTGDEFFIKYAESKLARSNVNNEGNILLQLKHLDFVPKLLKLEDNENFTLIKTNVLQGNRHINESVDAGIIDILKTLSLQSINVTNKSDKGLQSCFAHGDFCPWNMMTHQDKLWVFDWELAGEYPFGYDLFTYIFQTSALLHPQKTLDIVYKQHKKVIDVLFTFWEISNHISYLLAFAEIKLGLETKKHNYTLISAYQQLEAYAKNL